jgi:signal transduction histidine kinase
MGEMISMIAHQWRQPLGAISASSIDLKMKMAFGSFDLNKEEEQEECTSYFDAQLTHIEEYVQGLTNTIDDFRNFYKPNKEKKSITINEPIEKSLSIIQAAAKANGVDIKTDFKSQKRVSVHDSELMQVFLNIIKNAQDNFKEKGIGEGKITISTYDTSQGVCVAIQDNGGGISESIMHRIFDPYFSTKDEKNGTGLGLYMSKTIIEEHHHGKLTAKNSDNGVCFTIMINEGADENA